MGVHAGYSVLTSHLHVTEIHNFAYFDSNDREKL